MLLLIKQRRSYALILIALVTIYSCFVISLVNGEKTATDNHTNNNGEKAQSYPIITDFNGRDMNGCFIGRCWTTPIVGTQRWCISMKEGSSIPCTFSEQCNYNLACNHLLDLPRLESLVKNITNPERFELLIERFRYWANQWGHTISVIGVGWVILNFYLAKVFKILVSLFVFFIACGVFSSVIRS